MKIEKKKKKKKKNLQLCAIHLQKVALMCSMFQLQVIIISDTIHLRNLNSSLLLFRGWIQEFSLGEHKPNTLKKRKAVAPGRPHTARLSVSAKIRGGVHQGCPPLSHPLLLVGIYISCVTPTDIQGRSHNLRHFYSGKGLKLGVFRFPRNQNNHGSSGAYVTCIYCGLSVKIKHA